MRRSFPVLLVVLAVLATGCAARGGVPRPFPGAALPPSAPSEPGAVPVPAGPETVVPPTPGPHVVTTALTYRGVPYRNGGSDPNGFDCSGFVQYVFAHHAVTLPREVRDQYTVGERVRHDEIRPGDLVFFNTTGRGASHVGIAVGSDQFVHAPSSNGVVRVERYSSDYWARRFLGARRVE